MYVCLDEPYSPRRYNILHTSGCTPEETIVPYPVLSLSPPLPSPLPPPPSPPLTRAKLSSRAGANIARSRALILLNKYKLCAREMQPRTRLHLSRQSNPIYRGMSSRHLEVSPKGDVCARGACTHAFHTPPPPPPSRNHTRTIVVCPRIIPICVGQMFTRVHE